MLIALLRNNLNADAVRIRKALRPYMGFKDH